MLFIEFLKPVLVSKKKKNTFLYSKVNKSICTWKWKVSVLKQYIKWFTEGNKYSFEKKKEKRVEFVEKKLKKKKIDTTRWNISYWTA